jgi:hypothetical protein
MLKQLKLLQLARILFVLNDVGLEGEAWVSGLGSEFSRSYLRLLSYFLNYVIIVFAMPRRPG